MPLPFPVSEEESSQRLRKAFVDQDFGPIPDYLESGALPERENFMSSSASAAWASRLMGKRINPFEPGWQGIKDGIARGYFKNQAASNVSDGDMFGMIAADYQAQDKIASASRIAAARGESWLGKFREVETANAGSIFPGRLTNYLGLARAAHDEMAGKIAPYRSTISTVAEMARNIDTAPEGMDWGAMAGELVKVPKEDRAYVLEALSLQTPGDYKPEEAERLKLSFLRGMERFLDTAVSGAQTVLAEGGKYSEIPLAPETPEEAANRVQRESKADDLRDLRDDMRQIATGNLAPLEAVRVAGMNISGAVEMVPMTIGAFVPYVGFAAILGSFQRETYNTLRRANPGMSREDANAIATISAPFQAVTEIASTRFLFGRLPSLKAAFMKPVFSASGIAGQLAQRVAAGTAIETGEELVQGMVPLAVQDGMRSIEGALETDIPSSDWKGFFGDFADNAPELIATILPLALVGAGVGQLTDFRAGRQLARSPDMLIAAKYSPEAAAKISEMANAGKWSEAEDLMRVDWHRINAKGATVGDVKAGAEARIAAVQRLAELSKGQGKMAAFQDSTSPDYTVSVTRGASGWRVETGDGQTIPVDSAEAARRIAVDLRQVGSQQEADALVGIIDNYHAKDAKAETVLTGEDVLAGKSSVFAIRDNQERQLDSNALETIRKEAENIGIQTGTEDIFAHVNGSNIVFANKVGKDAKEIIKILNLYQSQKGGQPQVVTFLHESIESNFALGLKTGAINEAEVRQAFAALAPALDPARVRKGHDLERKLYENVRTLAAGGGDATMLRETFSELAVRDAFARDRSNKTAGSVGSISRAIEAAVMGAKTQEEATFLVRFRAMLKAFSTYLKGVLRTVGEIKRGRDKGLIGEEWDAFVDKVTGLDETKLLEHQAAEQAVKDVQAAGNMAFSVGYLGNVQDSGNVQLKYANLARVTHESEGLDQGSEGMGTFRYRNDNETVYWHLPPGELRKESAAAALERKGFNVKRHVVMVYGSESELLAHGLDRELARSSFSVSAITPAQDSEYLAAVERGDMAKAQAMVDAAAKAAGTPDIRFSVSAITPAQDTDYLAAVKAGDSGSDNLLQLLRNAPESKRRAVVDAWLQRNPKAAANMQRMVDEAAKAARYGEKLKHGSRSSGIQTFDPGRNREEAFSNGKKPWFFAKNEGTARTYGPNIADYLLKLDRPLEIHEVVGRDSDGEYQREAFMREDAYQALPEDIRELLEEAKDGDADTDSLVKEMLASGVAVGSYAKAFKKWGSSDNDGMIAYDTLDTMGPGDRDNIHIVFDPSQIKSADPVTYDDAGNVIPLSQRFNAETPDIRFSVSAITPAQDSANMAEARTKAFDAFREARRTAEDNLEEDAGKVRAAVIFHQEDGDSFWSAFYRGRYNGLDYDPSGGFAIWFDETKRKWMSRGEDGFDSMPTEDDSFEGAKDWVKQQFVEDWENQQTDRTFGQWERGKDEAFNILDSFTPPPGIDSNQRKPWEGSGGLGPSGSIYGEFTLAGNENIGWKLRIADHENTSNLHKKPDKQFITAKHWSPESVESVMREAWDWLAKKSLAESSDIRFSISPITNLEEVQEAIYQRMTQRPEEALRVWSNALKKIQKQIQRNRDGGWTWAGDRIRPISDKRTVKSLDKEQAMREATRESELIDEGLAALTPETMLAYSEGVGTLEDDPLIAKMLHDNGKLMSKSTAVAQGKKIEDLYEDAGWIPPSWYSGGTTITTVIVSRADGSTESYDSRKVPDEVKAEISNGTATAVIKKHRTPATGGIMPDVMADNLGFQYASEMWAALESSIKSHRSAKEGYTKAEKAVRDVEKAAKEQAKEEAQAWRDEAEAMQAEDWNPREAMIRDLVAYEAVLSTMPKEIRGQLSGGFVALARKGSEAGRGKVIKKKVELMAKLLERHFKKKLFEKIESQFEKYGSEVGKAGQQESKLTTETSGDVDFARRFSNMPVTLPADSTEKSQDAVIGDLEKVIEESEDQDSVEAARDTLAIANLFYDMAKMDASELESAALWLDSTIAGGLEARKAIKEARKAYLDERRGRAKKDVLKGSPSSLVEAENAKAEIHSSGWKQFVSDVKGYIDSVIWTAAHQLEIIFGKKSQLTEEFHGRLVRAANQETDIKIEFEARRKIASEAIFGTGSTISQAGKMGKLQQSRKSGVIVELDAKTKTEKIESEIVESILNGEAEASEFGIDTMTMEALADQWADNQALPGNRRKKWLTWEKIESAGRPVEIEMSEADGIQYLLQSQQKQSREQMERDGWGKASFEQLEAFLSPEAKAWAMFLSAEYERAGKIVAPVFERIFQTPFPVVPDYVPMSRDVANVDGMAPLDGQTSKGGIEAGFTKSRNKKARAELKRVDAFLSYLAHIDHLSHWVSFVEVTRDMKAIFNDVSVQNAITTKGGQENGTALRTRIKALENKGLDDANSLHTINNIFTRLNTLRAFKGLAFRISPIFKQFSAWANPLLGDVPAWAYLRGHARLMAGKIDVSGMFKSADIQRRIEHGFSPEARIAQKRLGMTGSQMLAIMGKGMRGMTLADAGLTGIGAAISFDFYRSQNEKAGMSKPDAEFEARRQLEILIAETAQPADQVNRSLLESTKNPVVQALLMFISESRKVAAIELMAIRNLATGNSVNKAMDIQRIIVAHGVSTLMTQTMVGLLALLMGDDEDVEREWSVEQWASSFLAGPINGIFILGRGVQMGINRLFKLRTFQNTQPYEKIFDDVYNAGKNLGDLKDDDAEKMRKEYLRLLTATSAAIATVAGPANPVTALDVLSNAAKDVGDVMTRD